ncbi:MAG TPA: cytochrome b/b6 domain-containing protein [Albitalea sp.]|nr:cytochrome b/b6 domain-containing protein [Albitalea sp.]
MADITPPLAAARSLPDTAGSPRVRVWDLPTRVFHWSLLGCVAGAVYSAEVGGNWMEWHLRFGAATLGLLAFRIVWGFAGPRYARFRSFLYAPSAVFAHLKKLGSAERHAGHSPSGAASVFALLGVLVAQSVSGLFSSDSIATDGALVRYVSEASVSLATSVHVKLQWVLYALVGLHVVAVLAYLLVKRDNLIGPMLHGDKAALHAPHAADSMAVRVAGLALIGGTVAAAVWLFGG